MSGLCLKLCPEHVAVCRLEATAALPEWAARARGFCSMTRTGEELSVVCDEAAVPEEVRQQKGWRMLRVAGTLDFVLTGVLESLARPLSEAGISIFALSTFDTDYLLLQEAVLAEALAALRAVGHTITE